MESDTTEPAGTAPDRHLIHLVAGNRWGGSRQYALDICSHYKARGWKVEAVTRDAKAVDDPFRRAGISLRHAPLRGLTDPSTIATLVRMIRDIPVGAGVIHAHRYRDAFSAHIARKIAKRPDIRLVVTRHTLRPVRITHLLNSVYAATDAHIFVSRTARDRFLRAWEGKRKGCPVAPEKMHVLLNSIPGNFLDPTPVPAKGPVIALCCGAITPGRGLETAIDALVSLRDLKLRLRIVGNGLPDYLDSLRRRAMVRGVMEMIDWRIAAEHPRELLLDSHFGVQPSIEREAFGLDNLRFMALGRAQVCSPNGAQTEFLEDGVSALFVPPADSDALARAIRRLATDPELRDTLASNAFKIFSAGLDWDSFISRLDAIYGLPNLNNE
ncbi:MAG: glycosyltransferase family 4 protein [Muribaculaceae bacterium]|nr:glycosyltransferase family 4 protein [Muribaculaceae bacterium]